MGVGENCFKRLNVTCHRHFYVEMYYVQHAAGKMGLKVSKEGPWRRWYWKSVKYEKMSRPKTVKERN